MFFACLRHCYSCTATILSDVNCSSRWFRRNETYADGSRYHSGATTLADCQKACEFDPRCVDVYWRTDIRSCRININPSHSRYAFDDFDNYELISRCNIALGQWFDSNSFNNICIIYNIYILCRPTSVFLGGVILAGKFLFVPSDTLAVIV